MEIGEKEERKQIEKSKKWRDHDDIEKNQQVRKQKKYMQAANLYFCIIL